MDDVLCDYTSQFNQHIERNPSIRFPQSQYGFFANLKPIDGAIDAMEALLASQYEPYILTAPSYMNPMCYTEKRVWVEKHLGMEYVKRLILSPNKSLLNGHYLIDDNHQGKGQDNFKGTLMLFGSEIFPDWAAIRRTLLV